LKLNLLALTIAAAISMGPTIARAQQAPPYQSPSQQTAPMQTPVQPTSPTQQPAPAQTPVQPAMPAQPTPGPTPMTQVPGGPTMTVEGVVISVETFSCGKASNSMPENATENTAGCTGVVEIAPGTTWADVARAQMRDEHDAIPMFGIQVRVLVGPNSALKMKGKDSTVSLADLKPGSTVRVDYYVANNLYVATDVNVAALIR